MQGVSAARPFMQHVPRCGEEEREKESENKNKMREGNVDAQPRGL